MKSILLATTVATLVASGARVQAADLFTTVPAGEAIVSKVVGINVDDNTHRHLGSIREIAYAGPSVKAYILEAGGHMVAIAPAALRFSYDAGAKSWSAAMEATADQIKGAPEFTLPAE
jgi:hypothetical protein